jgi:hypothetical protein
MKLDKKIERPKVYYTCPVSNMPVINEEEHFKICLSCRNSKHGLRNDILTLFGTILFCILLIVLLK